MGWLDIYFLYKSGGDLKIEVVFFKKKNLKLTVIFVDKVGLAFAL